MTDTTTDPEPQPLSEFLINYPFFDRAAGAELADLAAAVQAIDRKGSLTMTFKVEKTGTRVLVHVSTDVKPPKPDAEAGLFHVGAKGLSKDDPTQVRIDFATGELITPDSPKE
jgi:hypothetical protein